MSPRARCVAVLADVHGNAVALEAVLAEARARGRRFRRLRRGPDLGAAPTARRWRSSTTSRSRALHVRGNAERALLEPADEPTRAASAGSPRAPPGRGARVARDLRGASVSVDVDGLGPCPLLPRLAAERRGARDAGDAGRGRMRELSAGIEERTLVTAHTHLPVRSAGSEGLRSINPGSVGMPYGRAARCVLGTPRPRRGAPPHRVRGSMTAVARYRESGDPMAEQMVEILEQPPDTCGGHRARGEPALFGLTLRRRRGGTAAGAGRPGRVRSSTSPSRGRDAGAPAAIRLQAAHAFGAACLRVARKRRDPLLERGAGELLGDGVAVERCGTAERVRSSRRSRSRPRAGRRCSASGGRVRVRHPEEVAVADRRVPDRRRPRMAARVGRRQRQVPIRLHEPARRLARVCPLTHVEAADSTNPGRAPGIRIARDLRGELHGCEGVGAVASGAEGERRIQMPEGQLVDGWRALPASARREDRHARRMRGAPVLAASSDRSRTRITHRRVGSETTIGFGRRLGEAAERELGERAAWRGANAATGRARLREGNGHVVRVGQERVVDASCRRVFTNRRAVGRATRSASRRHPWTTPP